MTLFTRRTLWAYALILVAVALFALRRVLLPTTFELEGVPFDIAVASALNSCYGRPTLNSCADLGVVTLAVIGVVLATGWASAGRTIFAVILAIMPLGLFLALSPVWLTLILLLVIPAAIELVSQALFGRS
jgi:hypothetical protein